MNRLIGKISISKNQSNSQASITPLIIKRQSIQLEKTIENFIGEVGVDEDTNPNNSIIVILQGNIFGFDSYKKASTYLKKRYLESNNPSFLAEVNGSYNFVLYDKKQNKLYIGTDKYGSRPLFIYNDNKIFVFSSEVKNLLGLDIKPDIDWSAWGQYLTFRFTLGSNTFFQKIKLITGGTYYAIDLKEGVVDKYHYWDYAKIKIDYGCSFEAKVAEGVEAFRSAFRSLGSDLQHKKILLALSGGYDSRSIAAGLVRYSSKQHFDTITTLHPCGPEIEIVKKIVAALDLPNEFIKRPKNLYREYFINKAYLLDGLAQEHLWVMPMTPIVKSYEVYLDGIAGDIIMRSTRVRPIHAEKYKNLGLLAKLFRKQFGFYYSWLEPYVDPEVWCKIKYQESWSSEELENTPENENRMTYFLMNNRVRNGISLVPNNLMGNYVSEVMQPFFDDRIALFGLSLPLEYKFKYIYRKIIDAAYPEMSYITSTSDENPDKLKEYDRKITMFDDSPRELISDYLEMSKDDKNYLVRLAKTLEAPLYLNIKKFFRDEGFTPKINRVNTMVDIMLWYSMFILNRK